MNTWDRDHPHPPADKLPAMLWAKTPISMRNHLMDKIWCGVQVYMFMLTDKFPNFIFKEPLAMGNTASFFLVPRKLLIDMWFILMNAGHQSKNAGSAGSISEMFKIKSTRIPFFVDKNQGFRFQLVRKPIQSIGFLNVPSSLYDVSICFLIIRILTVRSSINWWAINWSRWFLLKCHDLMIWFW